MATILLGVSGSIAAYKAADLASKLKQAGHDVTALLTRAATELVSPNTFLGLTGNKCYHDLWDPSGQTEHIALTDRADLFVLAPATANVIGKLAHGLADDMVTTTLLAVRCPILVCPAMNTRMWENPAVAQNLERIGALGHRVVPPGEGSLACGHVGAGRLAEVDLILAAVAEALGEAGAPADAPAAPLPTPTPVTPASGAAGRQPFLEVVTYEEEPTAEGLDQERAYRAAAFRRGDLVASGRLGSPGSHRFGHLHLALGLEEAMARARSSPLAQLNCRIEVFPWKLDRGLPPLA